MMKRHGKRAFILLMVFCLLFTMMPMLSLAASDESAAEEAASEEAADGQAEEALPGEDAVSVEAAAEAMDADDVPEKGDLEQAEQYEPAGEQDDAEPSETEEAAAETGSPEATETGEAAAEAAEAGAEEQADGTDAETDDAADDAFDASKEDLLVYDPLYIAEYADPKYVDVSEMEMERFVNVVTAAKGIATYNVRKQEDFDVTGSNYIAGMNYEMPVYDVDDESDYYLALPDVNMLNGSFRAYDLMVAYNNDFAEMISGYKYEKGILYIPKSAIDHPKNESSVPEGSLIAVQMNYAIGGDMDFTKSIPVQILKKDEPVEKSVHTANLFEPGITVKTGVKNRREEDVSVFLNGHLIPISDGSWTYDKGSGELYIHEMPGVVSGINIVFRDRTVLETVEDAAVSVLESLALEAYAAGVTTDDMAYFRTPGGEKVVLKITGGELFTGWRGHYTAAQIIHGRQGSQTHKQAEAAKKKLKGWTNSVQYLYGGYTDLTGAGTSLLKTDAKKKQFDARIAASWAISSYALGADAGLMNDDGKLTRGKVVTHNVPVTKDGKTTYGSTEKHTIYEWLLKYQNQLKKSNGSTANNKNNGIAGATNFAVTFPDSIQGSSVPLVSSGANTGRYNESIKITSANMDSSYYIAASCNHLDDVAASDTDTDIYVTCLDVTKDYAVLAFAQARGGQNACAIYKFAIETEPAPKIGTTAAISDDYSVITDTIAYKDLRENQKYVFRGWLVDAKTGAKIPGSDGKVELNSGTKTSGSVAMKMDASKYDEMAGCSIAAFEELYIIINTDSGGKESKVAEHKDRTGSAETNPQIVEIYQDIKVRKTVTGSGGDHERQFGFTAEFTGLIPGQAYAVEGDDEKTFMADSEGKATAELKLADGQEAVIKRLPKGATYMVTEEASDHTAEYSVISEDMADKGAKIVSAEGSNGEEADKELATAAETVDQFDGTAAIEFHNDKIYVPPAPEPEEPEPEPEPAPEPEPVPEPAPEPEYVPHAYRAVPDTGDTQEIMVYILISTAAAIALTLFAMFREKSKKSL